MTNPTTPAGAPAVNGVNRPPPAAPPPNPRQQAVTFALELAKIRASAGQPGNRDTDVARLVADAKEIAAFIGQTAPTRTFG